MSTLDTTALNLSGLEFMAPLLALLVGVLLLICVDMVQRREGKRDSGISLTPALWVSGLSALAAVASCGWLWQQMDKLHTNVLAELFTSAGPMTSMPDGGAGYAWWGSALVVDRFGVLACLMIALVLGGSVLALAPYLEQRKLYRPEIFPLLLLSALGMMLLALSRDVLLSFAAIELLSLPLYVLCGLNDRDALGRESSLKYFLLGAFASGFLIYGAALLYGATGSLNYSAINVSIGNSIGYSGLLIAGLALLGVGLAFKLALVPFHAWLPDVYQGAPTPVTGFMATGVKLAVGLAFIRLIVECLPDLPQGYWQGALIAFAALSMLGGNLLALHQMSAKRLLACSAIAHSGYLAVGLAAGSMTISSSLLVYLVAYCLASLGAFTLISYLAPEGQDDLFLDQAHELHQQAPLSALALAVLLLSLGGFPLTAGFIGKLLLFRDAWLAGLSSLVIFALLNSVVSFYYYLRFVMAMYMQPAVPGAAGLKPRRIAGPYAAVVIATTALSLLLGVAPSLLLPLTKVSRLDRLWPTGKPVAEHVEATLRQPGG